MKTMVLILMLAVFMVGVVSVDGVFAGCLSGGCSGGRVGTGGLPGLSIGYATVTIGREEDVTGSYGSVTASGSVETNIKGYWCRVDDDVRFSVVSGPTYTGSTGNYTKIGFTIKDTTSNLYYLFEKENSSGWVTTQSAQMLSKGTLELTKISRWSGGGESFVTFTYDSFGRVTRQTSREGGLIVYGYTDPCDGDSTLTRIWAGTDIGDYETRSNGSCTGGRWIDVDYDSDTRMLTHIEHGCGGCGFAERSYTYVAKDTNLEYDPMRNSAYDSDYYRTYEYDPNNPIYDPHSDPCNYFPSEYLITEIAGSDPCEALVSYEYNSDDRLIAEWLGDTDTGLKVMAKSKLDYNMFDESQNSIHTHIIKDYVDNTYYRATVNLTGTRGLLLEKRYYHDLQSGDTLTGKYSRHSYSYEYDTSGRMTRMIETLPMGNKVYRSYSTSHGGMTELARSSYNGTPVTQAEYVYYKKTAGNGYKLLTTESTNTEGATTEYDYDSGAVNIEERRDPEVTAWDRPSCCDLDPWHQDYCGPGSASPDSRCTASGQVTEYEYDQYQRLSSETRKDADGEDVVTQYVYDTYGNLEYQFDAYDASACDPNDPNSCDWDVVLTTQYTYNEYNDQVTVTSPAGVVRKTYYSSSGGVEAEAVVDASDTDYIISATRYEYDDDGWLTVKAVVKADSRFLESDLLDDIDDPDTPTLSWVIEEYSYDSYGRRTATIADADGDALQTTYTYNNQSEIVKVVYPDDHYKETLRDGRGLVTEEAVGYGQTEVVTTEFSYDLNGNLIEKVDPEGVTEVYRYDAFDRMVRSHKTRQE